MNELPAELVALVVEHCTSDTLEQLRLVNKLWNEPATVQLFEHFYMGIFDKSLSNLVNVSNSRLAKYIMCVTVYVDLLPDGSYHKGFMRTPAEIIIGAVSKPRMDRARSKLVAMRAQQTRWHEFQEGLVFKEHIARLPNLREVNCVCANSCFGRFGLCSLPASYLFPRCIRFEPNEVSASSYMLTYDHATEDFARRITLMVLEAIALRSSFSGTKPITSLKISGWHAGAWEAMYIYLRSIDRHLIPTQPDQSNFPRQMNMAAEAFAFLTKLNWRICYECSDPVEAQRLVREAARLLTAAKQLRSLTLALLALNTDSSRNRSPHTHNQPGQVVVATILSPSMSWPQLEHLRLSIDVSHAVLLPFLRSLAPSLRSLELVNMSVDDADALIVQIPRILTLDRIYLRRIWHPLSGGSACLFPVGIHASTALEKSIQAYLMLEFTRVLHLQANTGYRPSSPTDEDGYDDLHALAEDEEDYIRSVDRL